MAIEITAKSEDKRKRVTNLHFKPNLNLNLNLNHLLQRKPKTQDRIFFTEQLSLLLETGTALHAALASLCRLATTPVLKKIINTLREDVVHGKSFSMALKQHPEFFNKAYVNLVDAAENGGFLDKVLIQLKVMDEKRERLKSKVTNALIYPGFLMFFSVSVVIFVLTIVFPKFADLFSRISSDLPGSTKMLMAASNLLINHLLLVSVSFISSVAGLVYWIKTEKGKKYLDKAKLSVYFVKDIFIELYLVQSLRLMSLSLSNGVSVMDTLEACKDVVENSEFNKFMQSLQENVKEGEGFASGFEQAAFIPSTVKQMIRTGDESGSLEHVMNRIADYYEAGLEKRLERFTRLVEPVMLIVMGGVVGVIVSSLILPIFKLSKAVG